MKKLLLIFSVIFLVACNSADVVEEDIVDEGGFDGEWSRVATYTDGADMGTGPASLNFLGDGTFVSTTALCTATGDFEVLPEEEESELGEMVLDAGRITMS